MNLRRFAMAAAGVALAAIAAFAAGENEQPGAGKQPPRRRMSRREYGYKRFGGRLEHPQSLKGRMTVCNAQSRISAEALEGFLRGTRTLIDINAEVSPGAGAKVETAPARMKELGAQAAIFVVDDPSYPPVLFSPDGKWVICNTAGLEGPQAEIRAKKRFLKAFAYLCGAGDSSYGSKIMRPAPAPQDLDKVEDPQIPVDIAARFREYLKDCGITQRMSVTYLRACEEGWAPPPTNDVQRAIWDKVNAAKAKPAGK